MKKALVTGASGFIGSHLVERLNKEGVEVHVLLRKTSSSANLKEAKVHPVPGDLLDRESLDRAVQGMDYVFHLAGVTAARDRAGYFQFNAEATGRLAQAVADKNPKLERFVYVSSQAAGGPVTDLNHPRDENDPNEPVSAYGESKLRGEGELLKHRTAYPITIIRPPIVYGPRDKNIFLFVQAVNRRIVPILKPTDDPQAKYYSIIYSDDLCRAILATISEKGLAQPSGEVFYVGNPKAVTYSEIIETIAGHLGRKFLRVPVPVPMIRASACGLSFLSRLTGKAFPFNQDKLNEVLPDYWVCSAEKAERLLGFQTKTGFSEGMRETVRWYQAQKWI